MTHNLKLIHTDIWDKRWSNTPSTGDSKRTKFDVTEFKDNLKHTLWISQLAGNLEQTEFDVTEFEENLKTHFQSPGWLATWSEQNSKLGIQRQLENTLSIFRLGGNSKTIPTTFYCNGVDPTSAQQMFQLQFICS